jgi:GxxExxY protein
MHEPSNEVDALAHAAIGAAIEVHRHLGPGYHESIYENAMAVELRLRGVPFVRQQVFEVDYKGEQVGEGRTDLILDSQLVIELKAVGTLEPVHDSQVLSYLKALQFDLGLLINFNVVLLKSGIRRIIRTE